MPPLRLLVITARYPTADRPAAGSFVRDRLADPGVVATVVAPRSYTAPGWRRYLGLGWRALTARGRFDGVEGHFVLPSGVVALLAARLRHLPLVVFAHGSDVGGMAGRGRAWRWLARRVLRGADAVIANSNATAEAVRRLGGRAQVVPPGIDLARFRASPRPHPRRVLYLGGSSAAKGAEVARGLADTLVGPGIREVDPAEVPGLLAAHDVLLVPSRAEGFGLVAAEAIAAGRWVVAADVGGLREVVSDGVNGSLVRDGDFGSALRAVPDYDPAVIAAGATRFDRHRWWVELARAWAAVVAARGQETTVEDVSGTQ
jgi:glycosyltransferase involved in cell wall biosynthesis